MIVVVPPKAAARVPVSKVSFDVTAPTGSSMCVWASTAPGITSLRAASISRSTAPTSWPSPGSTATIRSPSMSTSAICEPSALTTVPLTMSVRMTPSLHVDEVAAPGRQVGSILDPLAIGPAGNWPAGNWTCWQPAEARV